MHLDDYPDPQLRRACLFPYSNSWMPVTLGGGRKDTAALALLMGIKDGKSSMTRLRSHGHGKLARGLDPWIIGFPPSSLHVTALALGCAMLAQSPAARIRT